MEGVGWARLGCPFAQEDDGFGDDSSDSGESEGGDEADGLGLERSEVSDVALVGPDGKGKRWAGADDDDGDGDADGWGGGDDDDDDDEHDVTEETAAKLKSIRGTSIGGKHA